MNKKANDNLTLESYENDFFYKENKSNLNISFNRIAFIFFVFFIICLIYSIQIFHLGTLKASLLPKSTYSIEKNFRADIIDVNGNFIAKAVNTQTAGINPNAIIDKEKLLISLQILFPNKDFKNIKKRIKKKKYFRFKKELTQSEIEKLRLLGDKSIRFEEQLTRLYPQKNLFSHIIGQIDSDNNGISGLEKSLDEDLKNIQEPVKLTVDTDIQYLIRKELIKFNKIFNSIGSAAILMDVNNG